MRKIITLTAAALLAGSGAAMARTEGIIRILIPEGTQEIAVVQAPVEQFYGQSRPAPDTIDVAGQSVYELPLDADEAMGVMIRTVARPGADGTIPAVSMRPAIIYGAPGETLTVDLREELQPVSGSTLMEGISAWNAVTDSIMSALRQDNEPTEAQRDAIIADFNARAAALAAENADNALGVYMTGQLLDQEMMADAYAALGEGARTSILAPLYTRIGKSIERNRARAKAAESIKEGLPAPAFTLPDPEGKPVSLSDFKGKWVMLDFWGSWCGWCIKGIPQMKEEWAKMSEGGNVVYLSIDCGDTHEKWLAALKQYELPWVNVWSDPDAATQVSGLYAVQGFPTKLVVDPEGKIALIVVGEDPTFYDRFREAMAR